jgi:hypothetical protein
VIDVVRVACSLWVGGERHMLSCAPPLEPELVGRLLAGKLLAGRLLAGRLLAGRLLAGRSLAGRSLAGSMTISCCFGQT